MADLNPNEGGDYRPLVVIIVIAVLSAAAMQAHYGAWRWMSWMDDFMGFYFVALAMVKLFDLPGFAVAFQRFDLVARHLKPYAYLYPFIELGLGLGYLARWRPALVYLATVVVMVGSAIAVTRAMAKGSHL